MRIQTIVLAMALALLLSGPARAQDGCRFHKSEYVYSRTPSGPLKAVVFAPDGAGRRSRPGIVIFHGGGWTMGEPSWGFWLGERYACKGMVAVVAQYRLSDGKSVSPVDAVADARRAIRWMRLKSPVLRLDRGRVAALGWSAGAHLAASAAVFSTNRAERPDLLALVSPAVSVVEDKQFHSLLPKGLAPQDLSPAEHIRPGLPPTVIVTGRADTVTPIAGVTRFHERMLAAGNVSELHVYEGVGHLFTPAGQRDDQWPAPDKEVERQAYETIDRFLAKHGYIQGR